MEKVNCPNNCSSIVVKDGFQKGKQRYKCKNCQKKFQLNYTYKAYYQETNKMIITLLKEGCGVRSISRILQISKNTVLSRMLSISKNIQKPVFTGYNKEYEIDEIWTYAGSKGNAVWITYCIEKKTKAVIDFVVGSRTKEFISGLINSVLLLNSKTIFTDKLNIYPGLIPKNLHKTFKFCTNIIERFNLTIRSHIKRLSRRTLCFSKEENYLKAHLKIYFWG